MSDGSALGIELAYEYEEQLLGTAGGVRNVASFFGGEPFLVLAADALTDIDLTALRAAHERNGGIATLAVKRISNVSEYGVVIAGPDGRIQGFQEKPDPAEALSDMANCMIYVLEPEIFDYFPDKLAVDFALDVFPALLDNDVPFHVHVIDEYWNDVGSLPEYVEGNLHALDGAVSVDVDGTMLEARGGEEARDAGEPGVLGPVLVGRWMRHRRHCPPRRAAGDWPRLVDRCRGVREAVGTASRVPGPGRRDRGRRHLWPGGAARLSGSRGGPGTERGAPVVGGVSQHGRCAGDAARRNERAAGSIPRRSWCARWRRTPMRSGRSS